MAHDSLTIPQPEWPEAAELTVSRRLAPRFERIGSLGAEHSPGRIFVAAAVLADEEWMYSDRDVTTLATNLGMAGDYIKDNPETPVLAVSHSSLRVGTTTSASGLYFENLNSSVLEASIGVIPCRELLEADVDCHTHSISVWPRSYAKGDEVKAMKFVTPTNVLGPGNIDEARAASRRFVNGGLLVVGQEAILRFLDEAMDTHPGSPGSEERRRIASQTFDFIEHYDMGSVLD